MSRFKRGVSWLMLVTTTTWSVGLSLFIPTAALAAVTVTGPTELIPPSGMHMPASSFDAPFLKFSLSQSAGETLSSVAITILNNTNQVVATNTLATHISSVAVFADTNGNNFFDPMTDQQAGTTSVVHVATSTTVVTTASNNTIAATGGLSTSFFVTIKTAAGWAAPDSIKIQLAADGIVTSGGAVTTVAFTSSNAIDASIGGGGGGGMPFAVQKVTLVNPTTLDVLFSDFLNLSNTTATTDTANYVLSGTGNSAVTSVTVLPDNKSVRVISTGATLVDSGASKLAVSASVKNVQGAPNFTTGATSIVGAFQAWVISEVQVGSSATADDEFIELYNRSGSALTVLPVIHIVSASGTTDTALTLTGVSPTVPAHGFLLISPSGSPVSSTSDLNYTTSSANLVPDGAVYISYSTATSSAVIDSVCWGAHQGSGCEGQPTSALTNNGTSIERKAFNVSTAATMAVGGADASQGNSIDAGNNQFDFVARATPLPQNSTNLGVHVAETPSGGSFGGASNKSPTIQHGPIFTASATSTLTIVARMTDDGGALTAANTQLIFCTGNATCTPASTTPIYGTSIGSGWFKFTPTSTLWAAGQTHYRYYLQATDSASPAKTKVFTSDPSFDAAFVSTSAGIATTLLQQSKAMTITVSAGALGAAAISGTVSSAGVAVSGATVWLEGTQFSAVTGSDGSFSFSGVGPAGGKMLRIAKEGLLDHSMSLFVPSTGLVALGTITMYSGTMNTGASGSGDVTAPKIVSPLANTCMIPPQGAGGLPPTILITFSKSMDSSTIVNADASTSAATIYLTAAGSNTKLAGAVTAPSATQAVFTPSSVLSVGTGYSLNVTPAVKDTSGNPLGTQFTAMCFTGGQFFSSADAAALKASFGTGSSFPPFVKGSMPAPGFANVGRNTKAFVTFSEAMQDTASSRANVKLYKITNQFTTSESKTLEPTTNSFDTSGKVLIVAPVSTLAASAHYRVEVLGGISSSKGVSLISPNISGFATNIAYRTDFDTGASSDTTAPTVQGTVPAASATGVSTVNQIAINFSEAMDPSTISSDSIAVKYGSSAVDGTLTYDTNSWTARFVPTYALNASSNYTINVTTAVTDMAGNPLATELLRTFTTGAADSTQPTVLSAQGNDFALKVTFSKPMLAVPASGDVNSSSSVLNPENYSLKVVNSAGVVQSTVSVAAATFTYDATSRSVKISGLPTITGFAAGTTLLRVQVSGVKDIAFNSVPTGADTATSTAQSSAAGGDFSGGAQLMQDANGTNIQGGAFGPPKNESAAFKSSGIGFIPAARVLPFNTLAGATTVYGVEVPLSQQIPVSGYLEITFPDGTDVTNAKKDTNSPKNSDMNGQGTGTVAFATSSESSLPSGWTGGGAAADGVIVNVSANKVRVTLGNAVATRSESIGGTTDTHDFLRFDIASVVNPTTVATAATVGNTASVETKKSDGTAIESFTSGSFFTTAGGSFILRGRITSPSAANGVKVFLYSPSLGMGGLSTSTANSQFGVSDGEFFFSNLSPGIYALGVQQAVTIGETIYNAGMPISVNVNSGNCPSSICTQNTTLTSAATGAAVTLNITGTFSNDSVDIFAGGPGSFRKVVTTLNGVLAADTSKSIKLNANGTWMVGFGPAMSSDMFGQSGATVRPSWSMPKPQQVTVTNCETTCVVTPSTVSFNISATDKAIKFTVKDASGNKLGNAHVSAYSPTAGIGNFTDANADGTGSISLAVGNYKINANVPGMPQGAERSISIVGTNVFIDGSSTAIALSSMANSDLVLTISKASTSISGKVTSDGSTPVANSPVNASRTDGQGRADTFTNSSGEYTLYVNNGIWKVVAFTQQYGRLTEKTITISGSDATNQNFQPDTTAVNYASVTTSVAVDTNANGSIDSGEGLSNAQITIEGTTSAGAHYINTSATDSNGSSTLSVPPGTYTMSAWSSSNGDLPSYSQSLVVNSAGTITSQPADLIASSTSAVTVNVLDANGVPTTTDKMLIEFQKIGDTTDNTAALVGVSTTVFTLPIDDAGTTTTAQTAATSTSPAHFYLMKISLPGIDAGSLSVNGGVSTITATSSMLSGLWKVEVDATSTEVINIKLPVITTVAGTVKDAAGAAVADAVVKLRNSSTGDTVEVKADSSGNYSSKLLPGTYSALAEKSGYLPSVSTVTVTSSTTSIASSSTSVTAETLTIGGTITAGGSAVNNAMVKAVKFGSNGVGVSTGYSNASGTYSLNVTAGDWKVTASADSYTENDNSQVITLTTSNATSVDVALSSTNTSAATSTTALPVVPQSGATLSDDSTSTTIKASQSMLASSANTYSLSASETSAVVGGTSGKPISGEAKAVTLLTNDGTQQSLLGGNITITSAYSKSDLTSSLGTLSTSTVDKVKMGSFDNTTGDWEKLPTTVAFQNSAGNFVEPDATLSNVATVAYTGITLHLSVFNPTADSDFNAPSAPTSVTASGGASAITITWTAPTTNADATTLTDLLGYEIYRSTASGGTYTQLNTSDITGTTYTDSSAVSGVTYYYKVTAADTGGTESAFSSASDGGRLTSSSSSSSSSASTASGAVVLSQPVVATTKTAETAKTAEVAKTTTVATAAPTVAAKATLPVASMVAFSKVPTVPLKVGAQLQFVYKFKNGAKAQSVKVIRQLVNSKGKVVQITTGSLKLKPRELFTRSVKETLSKKVVAGAYTVAVKVYDAKGKNLLSSESFALTVAPVTPKKVVKKLPPAKKK